MGLIREEMVAVMEDRAEAWFRRRTSHWGDWQLDRLLRWKRNQGARVSVVIPARNEEETLGGVVGVVRDGFMMDEPLVDELVVMDSDSTDRTVEVAERAGATVYRCREVAQGTGAYPGKGEALWKSLLVTTGEILVFVDADLIRWGRHFIPGLLGPLLDPAGETLLVKGCYDRAGDGSGGGRVTELVARPLLNLWWPELAGVAQPLAGEWAARRSLLETLSIPVGYGVELAVLIDTACRHGTGAIAQVDLGERSHRSRPDADLAVMAAELLLVAERRRGRGAGVHLDADVTDQRLGGPELRQFVREDGALRPRSRPVPYVERSPVSSLRLGVAG
jgi:glucosyl-3-phosphoglycerate synthase